VNEVNGVRHETGGTPPQPRRGGRDIKKISRSLLNWSGRGGVGQPPIILLTSTTPSAPAKEASRHFAYWRSHPSSAEEGS
jgi:hypothetical protein